MAGGLDPLVSTTIAYYARTAFDALKENFVFWGLMKEQGKLKYDCGGDPLIGSIEAGRYRPITSAPGMDLTNQFVTRVRHILYNFPWGEMLNATQVDRGLLRRNSGDAALVDLSKTEIPALFRDLVIGPWYSATNEGSLSANILQGNYNSYSGGGLPWYGFPSFLLQGGATGLLGYNPDTASWGGSTGIAVASTDREATPGSTSQTYGGLTMALSGLTVDNVEPDAWTPTLVNASSSVWTGTANDVANAIGKVLNHLAARCARFDNMDPTYRGNFGLIDQTYYRQLGEYLAGKQTVYMQPDNEQAFSSPNLGYANVNKIRHGNVWWFEDKNMPSAGATISSAVVNGNAYMINSQQVEICFQKLYSDQENPSPLDGLSGEDAGVIETAINFDPIKRVYLVSGTIPGQMKASPRYHGRATAYA